MRLITVMTAKGFLAGLLTGLLVLPLGAWIYLKLGYAPVATSSAPMPFETYFAKMALHARVFKESTQTNPLPLTEANYLAGAKLYREDCAVCHGLPNQAKKTAIAAGMFPKPPKLFPGKGVTDDPAGETFWKIRNGIRLSGMPGYQDSLSDEQMWQITSLLANADKLPASVQAELTVAQP